MEAIVLPVRRRILALYQKGWSTRRIAENVGHSESGVRRIRQRARERGSVEPLKRGDGRPPKIDQVGRERLKALVDQHADATLDELLAMSQLDVSRSTIDRHLRKLKLTFKKKSFTQQNRIGRMSASGVTNGV
jgi:transposase